MIAMYTGSSEGKSYQLNDVVEKPLVSIIICTRDRAASLKETLQSMAGLQVPAEMTVELVLVDNGSTDATPEVMHAFEHSQMDVRVVREETPGLSNARNRGVLESRGDMLLFTDDDVRFPSDWIEQMTKPIRTEAADAVAGGVGIAPHLKRRWMTPAHRALLAATDSLDAQNPSRMVGANMAIARSVFDRIAGFDAELGAGALGFGEESLLAWQIRESGGTVAGALDVQVEHHFDEDRLTRANFKAMATKMGRSEAYLSYHWSHRSIGRIGLLGGLIYYRIKLLLLRARHWQEIQHREGMPQWEFQLLRKIHRAGQHLVERKRAPLYEPKGLQKRSSEPEVLSQGTKDI